MTTKATVDLDRIHEIYKGVKKEYSQYGKRFLYFLANCLYLDPDHDLEIALKLRPYGGLIGIDNSSLDVYFKNFKVLLLHALLHDACGFVYEYSEKGPGYLYVLPCPVTNESVGHVTDVAFCFYFKTFKNRLFNRLEYWLQEWLFLTFEAKNLVLLWKS